LPNKRRPERFQVKHTRIKPRYNAKPTAQEKEFHLWLMEAFECVCGCGQASTVVHHPLERHTDQRWRRDHEYVVPMFWECHNQTHASGSDTFAGDAWGYRAKGIDAEYLKGAA
jgi:hypothetical protein